MAALPFMGPLASLRERMGPDAASCSDEAVERKYRYAEAMAGLQVELMFAKAGIPGRTKH